MAAKTTTQSDPPFAAAVARVEPALTAWRQRRKHREPIPEALWKAMATLARTYGLSPVAQALRLNYTALKRQVVASAVAPASGVGPGTGAFVEVPISAWPQAPHWVMELEDGCGAKLTLRLTPCDRATALTLAQGLWEHRA